MPRLRVISRFIDNNSDILDEIPVARDVSAWLHGSGGIAGWGRAACLTPAGRTRFADADAWWRELCATAEVDDEVGTARSGLVAFASFAFADRPGESSIVVPETIIGCDGERTWVTRAGFEGLPAALRPAEPVRAPGRVRLTDDSPSADRYRDVVRTAVERLRAGEAAKVVLARDRLATAERDIDPRHLLRRLWSANAASWTFCVDGLIGSTPELLLRRGGHDVFSRVLAGTDFPGRDWTAGEEPALSASTKDRVEHEYAVRSVLDGLAPFTSELVAAEPVVLDLPTLTHLATDVHGVLHDEAPSIVSIVDALHPSAAVGGTPTDAALALIAELEPVDRGRYAGPVGWLNAAGEGEFGIALRCGLLDGPRVRLLAGCGVVAASDPDTEVAESGAKFRVMSDALRDEQAGEQAGEQADEQADHKPDDTGEQATMTATAHTATNFPHLRDDLARVRRLLAATVRVGDERINEPCGTLIRNNGRLFRPTLVLTSAYTFAGDGPVDDRVVAAAAVVEMLHVASLYHDDLCDQAETRRGRPTVNALHGDAIALLCGDHLLACCVNLLADLGPDAVRLFADTLKTLCNGQFLETTDVGDLGRDEAAYFESIAGKTAKLMSSSTAFGAMQAGADPREQKIMARYGHHLGVAFQIWDDLLDLWPDTDTGKPRFGDLRNGVYTLPVIHAMNSRPEELGALLRTRPLTDETCHRVLALLERTGARQRSLAAARDHVGLALGTLAELGDDLVAEVAPRLLGVARELMPEAERLLAAVLEEAA
ncbi:MAG TPA: chorismate-binding protein [Actinophytocola sp.]|nr:chorismate-binding protein [Actinophytocola sp.]